MRRRRVFFPLPLIRAIRKGMHDTVKADQHARENNSESLRNIAAMMFSASKGKSEPNESVSIGKSNMQKVGGGEIEADFNAINVKTQCFDEYTGEPLPNHLVRATMIEEMPYLFPRRRFGRPRTGPTLKPQRTPPP